MDQLPIIKFLESRKGRKWRRNAKPNAAYTVGRSSGWSHVNISYGALDIPSLSPDTPRR